MAKGTVRVNPVTYTFNNDSKAQEETESETTVGDSPLRIKFKGLIQLILAIFSWLKLPPVFHLFASILEFAQRVIFEVYEETTPCPPKNA